MKDPKDMTDWSEIVVEKYPDPRATPTRVLSYTGVRMTHTPTGIVAESREPQSMHKNWNAAHDKLLEALRSTPPGGAK